MNISNINSDTKSPFTHILNNIILTDQQIELIHTMNIMESHQPIPQLNNIYITTTLGILASDPGIGKSMLILHIIINKPYLPKLNNIISCNEKIISIYDKNKLHYLHTNIIVVPRYTILQWEHYIQKYTDLTYIVIKERKDINYNPFFYNKIDVILITPMLYKKIVTVINKNYLISRLIIDDIHILSLSNTSEINSCFTWFLSSNVISILYPNGCVINHRDKKTKLLPLYKNSFITKHIRKIHKHGNLKSIIVQSKNNYLSQNIKHTYIQTSITESIFYNYPKYQLFAKQIIEKKAYIKLIQLLGIPYIKNTITQPNPIECPICYNSIGIEYIETTCCKKLFCVSCICNHIVHQYYSKCPICRSKNCISNLHYIYHSIIKIPKYLLSKIKQLNQILHQLNHQHTMVVYNKLSKDFIQSVKNNYLYNINTTYDILQTIFSKQPTTLFVDSVTIQYGFNIPNIHNIIILDYPSKPIENIIISKCRKYNDKDIHIYHLYQTTCTI